MDKLDINPNIEQPTMDQRVQGKNLFHAPQPAIAQVLTTTLISADALVIDDIRNKFNTLNAELVKLGLLRHS